MKITKNHLKKIIKEELKQLDEEFRGSFSGKTSAEIGDFLRNMATYVESRAYPINDWLIDAGIKSKNPDDEWSVLLFTALDNLKKLAAELPAALDAGPGEAANPNKKPKVDDGYGDGL